MATFRVVTSIALGAVLMGSGSAAPQAQDEFTALLKHSLKGWTADRVKPNIKSGTLTLDRGGSLTFDKPLSNLVARLEIRMVTPESRAWRPRSLMVHVQPEDGDSQQRLRIVAGAASEW